MRTVLLARPDLLGRLVQPELLVQPAPSGRPELQDLPDPPDRLEKSDPSVRPDLQVLSV